MSGALRHGALGPRAAARLRALNEEIARLERERVELLLTVADAQGYAPEGDVAFSWDLGDDPRWHADPVP